MDWILGEQWLPGLPTERPYASPPSQNLPQAPLEMIRPLLHKLADTFAWLLLRFRGPANEAWRLSFSTWHTKHPLLVWINHRPSLFLQPFPMLVSFCVVLLSTELQYHHLKWDPDLLCISGVTLATYLMASRLHFLTCKQGREQQPHAVWWGFNDVICNDLKMEHGA